MKFRHYILLLLFILSFTCRAENNGDFYFRHYTNKDGLSHNTVFCSIQDQRGFMWFATEDGLNRFDGQTFTVYRNGSGAEDSYGLLHDNILSLFEDSAGRIWVCTAGGTCYYDYATNKFHSLKTFTGRNAEEFFRFVVEDSWHNLWFVDHGRTLKYNTLTRERSYYRSHFFVYATTAEDKSPIFVGVHDLFLYNHETDQFRMIPILTEKEKQDIIYVTTVREVPHGGYLVGTDKAGLKMYYSGTGTIETIIPDIQVRDILQYQTNQYWIASESGVYLYNMIDKSIVNLRKSLTNEYTIADNAVYSLTKDREGGVWLGSFFGGIDYLPSNHQNFKYYIGGKTHPGMLGNTVREIHPDQYGHLWLGTEDNGINRLDLRTGKIINYSPENPERKIIATNIHGLYPKGDTLWIGTFHRGIELLHIPTGKILKRYTQANSGVEDFTHCFTELSTGEFLAGTADGVFVFDRKREHFDRWHNVRGLTRQIYEDHKGRIWMVTNSGLRKYNPARKEEGVISYYGTAELSATQGLGSSNTTSVFEDSKGRIWITTSYGFSLYNEENDTFSRITTQDGLPSNIIYRIVEDQANLFWISTANGLVRFNPENRQMRVFTHKEGLHESQFNYSSSYKAEDGTIYMGTIDGMIAFNPQEFKENSYSPPLYITRVLVSDEKEENRLLQIPSDAKFSLKLPYDTPTFALSYIAPSYTSPQAIRYSYMLEGVDKEWIDRGTTREVTFANLSPGKYTFRVRSTNNSQVWQDNEQMMQVIITPPFWHTTWAYLFYFLLLSSLIIAFYTYKKRQLLKQQLQEQQFYEAEKEKELYHAKIQFFTFITHEIRTPLTLISAPLEKIIRSKDGTETTKNNLQIIQKNTQRLLDLSNQLLDFRKAELRVFRLNFVRTNIPLWVQTTLPRFISVYTQEGKEVITHIPETGFEAFIDREAMLKIFSNLLTNAMKYSEKRITITLLPPEEGGKEFSLLLVNDGPLVPDTEKEDIFTPFHRVKATDTQPGSGIGLSLSRSLAEFHKGTLTYQHTPEGLNQFTLTLPIEQEEHHAENATESIQEEMVLEKINTLPSTGKAVILVVEDQKDMRQFILDELADNYDILEAENGKIALALLEQHAVNLIISDIVMPVMDGYELCNQVKNDIRHSHIPLILLTAQHNLQSRLKGLNKGADAYMEKPFSLEHLAAQIENLLKGRQLLHKTYLEKPSTPPQTLAISPLDDLFLQKLNAFIEENLTNKDLNVEIIANEMGMSNSSLYRKVKGLSDLSPVDFIRIARLKNAVRLMQSGEKQVSEIAYRVGFSSPAYFSTCFQKQYGKSPSEFIREITERPA